jgi:hypothetical protein
MTRLTILHHTLSVDCSPFMMASAAIAPTCLMTPCTCIGPRGTDIILS